MKTKCVLCYSGGLDSTVLLCDLLHRGHEVRALTVHYGQRHVREIYAAEAITKKFGISDCIWHCLDLGPGMLPLMEGSSQTQSNQSRYNIDVPEGHYTEDSMKATVVPNRNMILLSLAGAWAISTKSDCVAYAAHAGDHAIYPDCRPAFTNAMREALVLADWHTVDLIRPFIHMTKADIVRRGYDLKVPFEMTWSCYKGLDKHCGKCGTCVERKEAFELAGIPDPTEYME